MQLAKRFDKTTLKKMGVSALLLLGGTFLTYLLDNILKLVGALGIPDAYKPIVLSIFAWLINTAKEWLKGEEQKVDPQTGSPLT